MATFTFDSSQLNRSAWVLLWVLLGLNALAIFGFGFFTLRPESMVKFPWAAQVFGFTYAVFARAQIVVALVCLVLMLTAKTKLRWLVPALGVMALSLASETVGVAFGFPFGRYSYTPLLGPQVGGVPWLIPPSWFFMGVVSYRLAIWLSGRVRRQRLTRIALAAALLAAWDLTLDPAMSHLSPFWTWGEPGVYYGSPLLNLFGWFVTGVVLMGFLELIGTYQWLIKLPLRFAAAFYAANLMLPVGLLVVAGLWGPLLISALAYALIAMPRALGREIPAP